MFFFTRLKIGVKNKVRDFIYWVNKKYKKIFGNKVSSYDFQTNEVLKKILTPYSNSIDIGAHEGAVFREILKNAQKGKHFLFEPLPHLYDFLKKKYSNKLTAVHNIALSDKEGVIDFYYIKKRPALSGIKLNRQIEENKSVEKIEVKTNTLDGVIPENIKVDLIKIDVEGAEFFVLKGGKNIITKYKPHILFECGLGGSDNYGVLPEDIFDFLSQCGLNVSLQEFFLRDCLPFTKEEFVHQFNKGYNYFFIAYPDRA